MTTDELPIAIRRTRRSTVDLHSHEIVVRRSSPLPTTNNTRKRPKKRVRFSDPGPSTSPTELPSTGLTPMVRRTSLKPSTTPTRRRASTPARLASRTEDRLVMQPSYSDETAFLPLRQVLDGRVLRRIRRNGLSEEMNTIEQEKRRRAKETKAEMDRLKAEVAAKDEEIRRLRNETIVLDTERIWELETQVADLKKELADKSGFQDSTRYDWTLAARDPCFRDAIHTTSPAEDELFGDTTMADLACSTPTRARNSFPTPPMTSPIMPATPSSHAPTPRFRTSSHAGVQACLPDPDKQDLEDELASLRLETGKMNTTLESYASFMKRITERLASYASSGQAGVAATSEQEVEEQLIGLFQALSDRTAALLDLTSSLNELGFPGADASDIISSLSSGFRTARLELEYLTPGEITLPLTSRGAEVLDLLLGRLRDLAKRVREDASSIDEYHEIELSLRRQLSARVAAMDGLSVELKAAQALLGEKTSKIEELGVSIDRLKGAVNGYLRDTQELEALVERMEGEGREVAEACKAESASLRETVASRDACVAALENKLAAAVSQAEALQNKVASLEASSAGELAKLNKQHGSALALRDARVLELRGEIDRINESLRSAHETIKTLRIEKSNVESKMEEEKQKAKTMVDSMKEELQRVVQMSQDFLETPKKQSRRHGAGSSRRSAEPEGVPSSPLAPGVIVRKGGLLSGDLARRQSGKKRRRYDSGLGFLDEDEMDLVDA